MIREGDVGTWSHCGDTRPHREHYHDVIVNEGPQRDVLCNGTGRSLAELRRTGTGASHHEDLLQLFSGGRGIVIEGNTFENSMTQGLAETMDEVHEATNNEGEKMSRSEVIQNRMAALEKELAALSAVEKEELKVEGAAVKFTRKLGEDTFTYLAINIGGGTWYTTATRAGEKIMTDDAFFTMLARDSTTSVVLLKDADTIK